MYLYLPLPANVVIRPELCTDVTVTHATAVNNNAHSIALLQLVCDKINNSLLKKQCHVHTCTNCSHYVNDINASNGDDNNNTPNNSNTDSNNDNIANKG